MKLPSNWRVLRRIVVRTLAVGVVSLTALNGHAQPSEAQVKAAFVFNFARFTEWPTEVLARDGNITLCIVGSDPFGPALNSFEGRTVNGRSFKVRRGVIGSADELRACQIVFLSDQEERRARVVMAAVGNQPVLVISEIDNLVEEGAAISLALVDNRIAFDVNVPATQRGQMRVSSQVLKLARNVVRRGT